jgi:AraC-like DNA-binding protein
VASETEHAEDGSYLVQRTTDPEEAQSLVAQTYLPNRLTVLSGVRDLDMELRALRLGSLTAGRMRFGRLTSISTPAQSGNFRIAVPLEGYAVTGSGGRGRIHTSPGEAAVIPPEAPTQVIWSADCSQLVLMVSRETLEWELEKLLGRSVATPLDFDFRMPRWGPVRGLWRSALDMIGTELTAPSGLATHTWAGLHAQGIVLDGLLLGHNHNYRADIDRNPAPGRPSAIRRAVELLQSHPERPWTVVGLATEVHLSVRALQQGFARDLQMPPMTYLRHVRLHRIHAELQAADPHAATVRAIATRLGIMHMGRLAAAYRAQFGESPSETLARPAT